MLRDRRRPGRGSATSWASATASSPAITKDNRTSGASYRGPGLEEGLRLLRTDRRRGRRARADGHPPPGGGRRRGRRWRRSCRSRPSSAARPRCWRRPAAPAAWSTSRRASSWPRPTWPTPRTSSAAPAASGVLLTERGSFFGYRDLVVDFRSMQIMRELGCPVVFDATHSRAVARQHRHRPPAASPALIPLLARCGVAAGATPSSWRCIPNRPGRTSDAGSQLPLEQLRAPGGPAGPLPRAATRRSRA